MKRSEIQIIFDDFFCDQNCVTVYQHFNYATVLMLMGTTGSPGRIKYFFGKVNG